MYLLYADESGTLSDPTQNFFILAGIAVFDRQTHWVEQELIKISQRFNSAEPFDIELHGSPMRGGRGEWKGIPVIDRLNAAKDALELCNSQKIRIFASIIDKRKASGIDILESSFEQLSSRFDMYLQRFYMKNNKNPQRGIMILDKSSTELQIQNLARIFKHNGHTWGKLRNFSEVPLFIDSKASKLMQLADLVCFALKRHYADNDDELYNIIEKCFDTDGGIEHGCYKLI